MIDLTRLTVSLTKHNAHKLANLLREHDASKVLENLGAVHVDRPQALKILSAEAGASLPGVWRKAQLLGDQAIDGLLLIGIIFSHHQLIGAMAKARIRRGTWAVIQRDTQLGGKAYTNFVRIVDQLGFAKDRSDADVTVDLASLLRIQGLGPLAGELLAPKLKEAGWDGTGDVEEIAVRVRLHESLGVTGKAFKAWIASGAQPKAARVTLLSDDEEFFGSKEEGAVSYVFEFRAGHRERSVENVGRAASDRTVARQLHNEIQNRLYKYFTKRLGRSRVGTEIRSGTGTTIDLATKSSGRTVFYEIKTSTSVRTSIRQAIPQLLEYAHWPKDVRAHRFVIVSQLPITRAASMYLEFLRKQYAIPLYYAQFDLSSNMLVEA